MKIFKILTLTILASCASNGYSQVYEAVYDVASSQVQTKMNENKMQGIDILSGVESNFVIGLTGILGNEKSAFIALLDSDEKIINYTLSEDNSSISIHSTANFTIENFLQKLSTTSGVITGSNVVFVINEQ